MKKTWKCRCVFAEIVCLAWKGRCGLEAAVLLGMGGFAWKGWACLEAVVLRGRGGLTWKGRSRLEEAVFHSDIPNDPKFLATLVSF